MNKLIYVVEDDESIRELTTYALENDGYNVVSFEDSRDLFFNIKKQIPELIVLDIMLPYENGIEVLKKIRNDEEISFLPVILLTAKSSEYDKVLGLNLGADDYITKPFSVMEFLARVKAVLRRKIDISRAEILNFKQIKLNIDNRIVLVDDVEIFLTYKEFELLQYLIENVNKVLNREKILTKIWGYDYEGETRTVDVHIANLRQKIGNYGVYLKTVRGIGYKLEDKI